MIANIYIVLVMCQALVVTAQTPKAGIVESQHFSTRRDLRGSCLTQYDLVKISHLPKAMHLLSGRISTKTQVFSPLAWCSVCQIHHLYAHGVCRDSHVQLLFSLTNSFFILSLVLLVCLEVMNHWLKLLRQCHTQRKKL